MCGFGQNPFYKSSCAPIRENFGTMKFIFHVHVLTRENSGQYCCIRRQYYFTRIWKILHWKYHRDICKEHSQDISLSCHIVANTLRTLVKDMISNTRYFWRGKFYLSFTLNVVYPGRKSTPILSASARSLNNTSRHNFITWRKTKKTN